MSIRLPRLHHVLLALTLTVSAGTAAERDDSAAEKLGWKLGLQAWTTNHLSLMETLDVVKSLGLKYIEMFPGQKLEKGVDGKFDHNSSAEARIKVKAKLKELGITATSYGVVTLGKAEVDVRKVFDFAKDMGLLTIVCEAEPGMFDMLDKLVREYSINIALHNHPEPSRYWNPDTVLAAIAGHDPRIGSCSDLGHWPRSGLKPVDCVHKLEGHVIEAHLKDTNKIGKGASDVVLGTGAGDIPAVLAELHRQGFRGVFSIEYEIQNRTNIIDELKQYVATFDKITGEIAAGATK
jgi:sugar phosphate isomerase/epimerase